MRLKKDSGVQNPAATYQQCPACKSKNLIRLEVDAICGDCDWDSTAEFVASGGMDNLFAAYRDHFGAGKSGILNDAEPPQVNGDENAAEPCTLKQASA